MSFLNVQSTTKVLAFLLKSFFWNQWELITEAIEIMIQ